MKGRTNKNSSACGVAQEDCCSYWSAARRLDDSLQCRTVEHRVAWTAAARLLGYMNCGMTTERNGLQHDEGPLQHNKEYIKPHLSLNIKGHALDLVITLNFEIRPRLLRKCHTCLKGRAQAAVMKLRDRSARAMAARCSGTVAARQAQGQHAAVALLRHGKADCFAAQRLRCGTMHRQESRTSKSTPDTSSSPHWKHSNAWTAEYLHKHIPLVVSC